MLCNPEGRYHNRMGKNRRKNSVKKTQNTTNRVTKPSEIAPSFKKNSDNEFQDALAKKDFEKAKNISC